MKHFFWDTFPLNVFYVQFFQSKKWLLFFLKNFITCKMMTYRREYNEKWILTPNPGLHLLLLLPKAIQFSSVQFSCSVMSDSLRPHELQHARPPCPSPTPGVHSNSSPSSRWCHPAISSSVIPFSSCPQSLPASESFPMSQLFSWGGQSTGVSAITVLFI